MIYYIIVYYITSKCYNVVQASWKYGLHLACLEMFITIIITIISSIVLIVLVLVLVVSVSVLVSVLVLVLV